MSTPTSYVERVNRAIDHVVGQPGAPSRLGEVAAVAGLSPFHFHRVFQAMVGVTLSEFTKRLRLERAVAMMAHAPRRSLTTVALSCGFSSSSDFSRCFRQRFGVAPSRFDIVGWRESHRLEIEAAAEPEADRLHLRPIRSVGENPDRFRVRIRELPARTVAYIRVLNPYRSEVVPKACARLVAWAEKQGLAGGQWLGYQWDNPEITALEDCQYQVAVEAERFSAAGEVGRFRFPAMTVAEVEVRGGIELEIRALQWLYGVWLPRSGYVPDDQPCFEAWIGRPFAHGGTHFELNIQLPVKRG